MNDQLKEVRATLEQARELMKPRDNFDDLVPPEPHQVRCAVDRLINALDVLTGEVDGLTQCMAKVADHNAKVNEALAGIMSLFQTLKKAVFRTP